MFLVGTLTYSHKESLYLDFYITFMLIFKVLFNNLSFKIVVNERNYDPAVLIDGLIKETLQYLLNQTVNIFNS